MILVVSTLLAQVRPISLEEALARADAQHPALALGRARTNAMNAEEQVASSAWLPRVGAMAQLVLATTNNSTATVIGSSIADLPRIGATPIAPPEWLPAPSTTVAVGVRQQLFDFGKTSAELAAAIARTDVERARLTSSGIDVRVNVAQAWFTVKAAHAILASTEAARARAKVSLDFVRAAVASQLRAPVEQTRASVELQRAELAALRAQAQVELAQQQLGAAVGLDERLDAEGEALNGTLTPLEPLLAGIEADDSRIVEAKARASGAAAVAEAVTAQTRPLLLGTAALSGRAGGATPNAGAVPAGAGWLPVIPNWDVGLIVSWQAIDPVVFARSSAAKAQAAAAASEVELVRQAERTAVRVAWLEAENAARALPTLRAALESAVINFEQAEVRFRLGLGTQLELTEAERLRTDAEIQLALGTLAIGRATVALNRFTTLSKNP